MINKFLKKQPITIAVLGIIVGAIGNPIKASASSLSPSTIINTWTPGPEVVYGLKAGGTLTDKTLVTKIWGVDNTLQKVPFSALTNFPYLIGRSSDRDSERYGSLVSDFTLTNDFTFKGSFFMPNDNDIVGLLWGYQDANNNYRLSWGSDNVKRGTLVDGPYERPDVNRPVPTPRPIGSGGFVIAKEVNGVTSFFPTTFNYNLRWQTDLLYDFNISRLGDNLSISINQGTNSIFSTILTDTTFLSGKVGFNTAGVEVFYGNIETNGGTPPLQPLTANATALAIAEPLIVNATAEAETVTEPSSSLAILGSGLALGMGAFFKRKINRK